jgi:hypothetical protein
VIVSYRDRRTADFAAGKRVNPNTVHLMFVTTATVMTGRCVGQG